jgi:hypothetical protein
LTDVVVLTENASQIAHREEYRAATAPAAQAVFLARMQETAADLGISSSVTSGRSVDDAIDAAIARTN